MATILIGLDDTDNAASRGTGRLARELLKEFVGRGIRPLGVTRHQLLLDARIPYTSHNSSACVGVAADDGADLAAAAFDFVASRAAEGSDPGVCVAPAGAVGREIVQFGQRATSEIVAMAEAEQLARAAGARLRALGGSGLGIIGALAATGLRAGGGEGRFIDLPGLRSLPDRLRAADFQRLGIRLAHEGPRRPRRDDAYETLGWVRPRLLGGQPVLPVQWNEEQHAWLPVDRRRSRRLE
jgi:hypothetical protein